MGLFAHIGEVDMKSVPGVSGLHEPICEAIGLALDRGIERLDRVRIVLVREHGAFRVQYEAGRLHLLANGCRLNAMYGTLWLLTQREARKTKRVRLFTEFVSRRLAAYAPLLAGLSISPD